MRTKAVLAAVLFLTVGVVGVSDAAIRYIKGAMVMTWPASAETRANVIAAGAGGGGGASGFTLPDIDLLPPGTAVGAFGLYVRSDDEEFNAAKTNWATATARYNFPTDPPPPFGPPVAGTLWVDVWSTGRAGGALGNTRDGNMVAALGDTAVDMAFSVRVVPTGGTSANLIINGTALLQRTIAGPGIGRLDLLVYPDSVAANLDPTGSGAGAIFKGRLIVDKDGIEKADGGFTPGNFAVQLTTNHARVTATGLIKPITCPNSALLATVLAADSDAQAVPGHTPIMIGILSLLMAGVGFMALRRPRLTA